MYKEYTMNERIEMNANDAAIGHVPCSSAPGPPSLALGGPTVSAHLSRFWQISRDIIRRVSPLSHIIRKTGCTGNQNKAVPFLVNKLGMRPRVNGHVFEKLPN